MNIQYNNIAYDNVGTPNQNNYNNVGVSDELKVNVPNNDGVLTSYAAGKRAKKAMSVITSVLTITIAGGVGGISIANVFVASPKISQVSFALENDEVVYSFSISGLSTYLAQLIAKDVQSKEVFYTLDMKGDGDKEGKFSAQGHQTIEAEIFVTNHLDYQKSLYIITIQ